MKLAGRGMILKDHMEQFCRRGSPIYLEAFTASDVRRKVTTSFPFWKYGNILNHSFCCLLKIFLDGILQCRTPTAGFPICAVAKVRDLLSVGVFTPFELMKGQIR